MPVLAIQLFLGVYIDLTPRTVKAFYLIKDDHAKPCHVS